MGKIFNRRKKNKNVSFDHPTKEEYEENIRQINEKELNSSLFKETKEFVEQLEKRENRKLEEELFSIVGNYIFEAKSLYIRNYSDKKLFYLKRFYAFVSFINSLKPEDISSNLYLKVASQLLDASAIDCEEFVKMMQDESATLASGERGVYSLDIDIPEERLKIFPLRINTMTGVKYYRPEVYVTEYVYRLTEENRYVYDEYNKYVNNVIKLATDIYHLQIWNIASKYKDEINNYNFLIHNNNYEHKFAFGFTVRKPKKDVQQDELKLYELSLKTRNNISRIIGLPFDDIVKMDSETLEVFISQRIKQYQAGLVPQKDIQNNEISSKQNVLKLTKEGGNIN